MLLAYLKRLNGQAILRKGDRSFIRNYVGLWADRSMFKLLGYALLQPTYAGPIGSHYLAVILMPKPVRFAAQKRTLRRFYFLSQRRLQRILGNSSQGLFAGFW
jgi:hypothetical protein